MSCGTMPVYEPPLIHNSNNPGEPGGDVYFADIKGLPFDNLLLKLKFDTKVSNTDARLSDARTPLAHSHAIGDVTNLQSTLDGKALNNHNHDSAYSAIGHNHDSLYAQLIHNHDLVYSRLAHHHDLVYSKLGHNHAITDVTGLRSEIDGKAPSIHRHDDLYAPIEHATDATKHVPTGGGTDKYLTKDTNGNLIWNTVSGGTGTGWEKPTGAEGELLYYNAGDWKATPYTTLTQESGDLKFKMLSDIWGADNSFIEFGIKTTNQVGFGNIETIDFIMKNHFGGQIDLHIDGDGQGGDSTNSSYLKIAEPDGAEGRYAFIGYMASASILEGGEISSYDNWGTYGTKLKSLSKPQTSIPDPLDPENSTIDTTDYTEELLKTNYEGFVLRSGVKFDSNSRLILDIDASKFTKNLTIADDTLQKALETLDKLTAGGSSSISWGAITGDINSQTDLLTMFGGYSLSSHNHDSIYSPILHDHDLVYSKLTHNHDSIYSLLGHNHDSIYAPIGHATDATKHIPSGASLDQYLTVDINGNYVWKNIPGIGGGTVVTWGDITGDITNQTDIINYFALKNHHHDSLYAPVIHNHDSYYSPIGHDHNIVYDLRYVLRSEYNSLVESNTECCDDLKSRVGWLETATAALTTRVTNDEIANETEHTNLENLISNLGADYTSLASQLNQYELNNNAAVATKASQADLDALKLEAKDCCDLLKGRMTTAEGKITTAEGNIATLTAELAGKAETGHTHAIADTTGLTAELAGKASQADLDALKLEAKDCCDLLKGKVATAEGKITTLEGQMTGKAAATHGHEISDVSGLATALNGKATTSDITTLEGQIASKEPAITKKTGFNLDIGTTVGTVAAGNDSRFTDARTPTAHNQATSTITGLDTALAAKEVTTNKATVLTTSNDTLYPTVKAVVDALATKQATIAYTTENVANKATVLTTSNDTLYPTVKAVNTALALKLDAYQFPAQTGNSGKYLTTDGSAASWTTIAVGMTNFSESNYSYLSKYGVKLSPNSTQTDVDVAIQPKGTGAVLGQQPNGAITGGEKRGNYAVDWQTRRTASTQVASGANSTISGGYANTASGQESAVGGGFLNNATGAGSVITGGSMNSTSGTNAVVCGGMANNSTADSAIIIGGGNNKSNGYGSVVSGDGNTGYLPGHVVLSGANQTSKIRQNSSATLQAITTDGNVLEMFTNLSNRLVLKNNQAWTFKISILAHSSTNIGQTAQFTRVGTIFRRASIETTALEGAVQTIGTDIINSGLTGVAVAITADPVNGSLKVSATGLASNTIAWQARVELIEIEI